MTVSGVETVSPDVRNAIENLVRWTHALTALRELHARGIPLLVTKSLPQVEVLYGHAGGRCTGDIEARAWQLLAERRH
jgi:hypothetical protein